MCIKELNQTLVMITHDYDIAETADRIITQDSKKPKELEKLFDDNNLTEI